MRPATEKMINTNNGLTYRNRRTQNFFFVYRAENTCFFFYLKLFVNCNSPFPLPTNISGFFTFLGSSTGIILLGLLSLDSLHERNEQTT